MDPNSNETNQQPVPSTRTPPVSPGFATTQASQPQSNIAQSAPPPLSRSPHLPILPHETQININSTPKSGKNVLITMLSILILAIVIIITLWLFIQNSSKKNAGTNPNGNSASKSKTKEEQPIQSTIPTLAPDEQKEKYGDVVCYRFTSLEEALKAPSIACILDLSNLKISTLPEEIAQLTNLTTVNLSKNDFRNFPEILLDNTKIQSIDLSNNKLTNVPSQLATKTNLLYLNVSNNLITETTKQKLIKQFGERIKFENK